MVAGTSSQGGEKWWREDEDGRGGRVRGERGDRLAVLTTIFYVRVSRTDHLPPPRKICFATRTWVGYDVRELLLGKKNTHLCGGGVKESNSTTTLIKSFSVFYLIKMASSNVPWFPLF